MTHTKATLALALACLFATPTHAQTQDQDSDKTANTAPFDPAITDCYRQSNRTRQIDCAYARAQTRAIHLVNVSSPNQANEMLTALRNLLEPSDKMYLVPSSNTIMIHTYPEEIARAEAIVRSLDVPAKSYRLTFTLTETEAGKTTHTDHVALTALGGQRVTLKQGSKIPLAIGSSKETDPNSAQNQITYLDVGMNFDITPTGTETGVILKSKVEQSSVAPEKSAIAADPIIQQSVIDGVVFAAFHKPTLVGSADIAGTSRHLEVSVVAEMVP